MQPLKCTINNLGGRRFVLTVGCGLVCSLLLMHGDITPEIFRDITLATVAVYIGANTYQKHTQIKSDTTVEVINNTTEGGDNG